MIGKTRHKSAPKAEEVFDTSVGRARGVLRSAAGAGKFTHARRAPAEELSSWIAHYWMVSWDLRGCEPHVQETLPHPNFHVVLEAGKATVSGVYTKKFTRVLREKGQVFGIKFQSGGFRPFLKGPASELANTTVGAKRFLGEDIEDLAKEFARAVKEHVLVRRANAFFAARMPVSDPQVRQASELVRIILQDGEIKTVDDLAARTGIGRRTLQRIFKEYVGASPKWVIRRYRLHELVARFQQGGTVDWAKTAVELGYFDQAHLINDFRKAAGYTPAQYREKIGKHHAK